MTRHRHVTCVACQRGPLASHGRDLCATCHRLHTASGTLRWFPPHPRSAAGAEISRADYAELRSWGESREQAAARIGIATITARRYDTRIRKAAA